MQQARQGVAQEMMSGALLLNHSAASLAFHYELALLPVTETFPTVRAACDCGRRLKSSLSMP